MPLLPCRCRTCCVTPRCMQAIKRGNLASAQARLQLCVGELRKERRDLLLALHSQSQDPPAASADSVPEGSLPKILSLAVPMGEGHQGRDDGAEEEEVGRGVRAHLEALAGTLSRLSAALGSLADCW